MTPIPSGRACVLPLDQIKADDKFNARKTYRDIEGLAASIDANGLEQPLVVYRVPRDPAYHLQSGFRRVRALHLLQTKKRKKLEVPCVLKEYASHDEAMLAALAVDATADPLRTYDLATRCKYLCERFTGREVAIIVGIQKRQVTMMVTCLEKLDPKVLDFWSKCSSPETEPALYRLVQWSQQSPMIQQKLLDAYRDGDRAVTDDDGVPLIDERRGRRVDGGRPNKRYVRKEIDRLTVRIEDERDEQKLARYEGMKRALKWTLGEVAKLHG